MMQIDIGDVGETPIGHYFVLMDASGLRAVCRQEHLDAVLDRFMRRGAALTDASLDLTAEAVRQIRQYLAGERRAFELPIHWDAMRPFQRDVLQATYAIPYGETRTYGEVAALAGHPRAARAVGRAQATNPIPIVIPCHRVVAANGLGGYGGADGLPIKRWLLRLEGAVAV